VGKKGKWGETAGRGGKKKKGKKGEKREWEAPSKYCGKNGGQIEKEN